MNQICQKQISLNKSLRMKTGIFLIIIIFSCLSGFHFSQAEKNKTLAIVGNHTVTLTHFENRYYNYLISTGISDNIVVRRSILNNMINEILLYNYDSNEEVFSNREYLKELEEARKRTILAYLKDQEIFAKITVTEKEIREAFTKVNEKISARHLYAATEEEANKLYELLRIGVSFESLASQVFTDSVLKNNGGYLGYFTWGDMDPAFEEVAYSLKVGEISPPVKTVYGYSIIKLEGKVSHPLLTEYEFQKKKSHLERVLKIRKKTPSEKDYINSVFDRSKLSFDEQSLKNILVNLYKSNEIESGNIKNHTLQCVTYKERIYSQSDIEKKLYELPSYHKGRINSIETLRAAVEGILINEILYNIALSKGYDKAEPVLSMYDKYKKNIFSKFKIDAITKTANLPDSTVFNYYKNNISIFSTENELNLQEILVSDESLADSLLNLINNGNDFGELAKRYSLRHWSAENNGIMGFAPVSKFGSYGDTFWDSKVGEIIGPIKIENFCGIFRVLGKTESQPIDFDLIKEEVTKAAQFEMQTGIIKDYIELLHNKVNVKIDENLLGSYDIAG